MPERTLDQIDLDLAERIEVLISEVADVISEVGGLPRCREYSLTRTKLQEALFWLREGWTVGPPVDEELESPVDRIMGRLSQQPVVMRRVLEELAGESDREPCEMLKGLDNKQTRELIDRILASEDLEHQVDEVLVDLSKEFPDEDFVEPLLELADRVIGNLEEQLEGQPIEELEHQADEHLVGELLKDCARGKMDDKRLEELVDLAGLEN